MDKASSFRLWREKGGRNRPRAERNADEEDGGWLCPGNSGQLQVKTLLAAPRGPQEAAAWGLRWHPGGQSPWTSSDGTSSEPRLESHGPRQFPPLKRTVPATPAVVGPQASGLLCAGEGGGGWPPTGTHVWGVRLRLPGERPAQQAREPQLESWKLAHAVPACPGGRGLARAGSRAQEWRQRIYPSRKGLCWGCQASHNLEQEALGGLRLSDPSLLSPSPSSGTQGP